jgi:hypothetical protein
MGKFEKETKFLWGKKMTQTYWGLRGSVSGMYCRNSRYHLYGIKGIFGISFSKAWGANM